MASALNNSLYSMTPLLLFGERQDITSLQITLLSPFSKSLKPIKQLAFPLPRLRASCYTSGMNSNTPKVSLSEIFLTFATIGLTGFGGGMAIVALIERVCVKEKQWLGNEEFLHGLAFGQLLGPFSLNTCTFIGYHLRGIRGGITAAVAFIFPSFILVTLLSWLYFTYNKLPQLQAALKGTNPVVIGLIVVVAIDMGRKQIKNGTSTLMALTAFAATVFLKLNAAWVLLAAAAWSLGLSIYRRRQS
jgi:chromate transporter